MMLACSKLPPHAQGDGGLCAGGRGSAGTATQAGTRRHRGALPVGPGSLEPGLLPPWARLSWQTPACGLALAEGTR